MNNLSQLKDDYTKSYLNKKARLIRCLNNDKILNSIMTKGSIRILEIYNILLFIDIFEDADNNDTLYEALKEFDDIYENYQNCTHESNAYFELRHKLEITKVQSYEHCRK